MFERKREPLYKIDLKDVYKGPGEDAKKLMGDRIKINSDFKRFQENPMTKKSRLLYACRTNWNGEYYIKQIAFSSPEEDDCDDEDEEDKKDLTCKPAFKEEYDLS